MRHFYFIFATLLSTSLFAQNENRHWTFGYGGGLYFNPAGFITEFESRCRSREGVAAYSDPTTGALMFYTDGVTVWNAQHQVMQYGNDLKGDYSSCQSGVIVPLPGTTRQFYIFTSDYNQGTDGYRYSVVDMTANGGLGRVDPTRKNIQLIPYSTEKITVARHCNGRDYWLVLRQSGSSRFWVYEITPTGIASPKNYDLGAYTVPNTWNSSGILRFSPDQHYLAHTVGPATIGGESWVEIFSFDDAAGVISGPFLTIPNLRFAYAAEFSPNEKLLYVSNAVTTEESQVYQYNLALNNNTAVLDSRTTLVKHNIYDYGTLQLGPDGRIYVAKEYGYDTPSEYIDIIHYPNLPGAACFYQADGIELLQGKVLMGLPNFPAYYLKKKPALSFNKNCDTGEYEFTVNDAYANAEYYWNFGDPGSGIFNISNLAFPKHRYAASGNYEATVRIVSPCSDDTLRIALTVQTLDLNDASFCPGGSVTLYGLDDQTLWNQSVKGFTYTATQPGWVTCAYKDEAGCNILDSVKIDVYPEPKTSETIITCSGKPVNIFGQPTIIPGIYSQTLPSFHGCDSTHTITLEVTNDTIWINEKRTLCDGDTLLAHGTAFYQAGLYKLSGFTQNDCPSGYLLHVETASLPKAEYKIHKAGCNGKPDGAVEITEAGSGASWRLDPFAAWTQKSLLPGLSAGVYKLEVQSEFGCLTSYDLAVPERLPLSVWAKADTSNSFCGSTELFVFHNSSLPVQIQWTPAELLNCPDCPTAIVYGTRAEKFTVVVTDTAACTGEASIEAPNDLRFAWYAPNIFSPDDDGYNDRFTLYGNPCVEKILYLQVYDRWGNLFFSATDLEPGDELSGWDGIARNKETSPGVYTWIAELQLSTGDRVRGQGSITVMR